MRPVVVVARHEGVEARLPLQDVGRGGLGRLRLQRAVDALMPAVLLWVPRGCCRPGEVSSLQWRDVDLARREIRIRGVNAKDREDRMIPITSRLAAVLEMRRSDPEG